MSLSFARSTRALHTERPYPVLAVLVLAFLLLGLWAVWFCWPSTPLYETGQLISATRRDTLLAAFPVQAMDHIQPGQVALLRPQGDLAKQIKGIPALVMGISNRAVKEQMQVELAPLWTLPDGVNLAQMLPGQVDVEVERISPAQMVWRSARQGGNTAAVVLNPQTQ